jgi:glycosyltransferase involved in cell wall biosynthesis
VTDLSVVVCAHNEQRHLAEQLAALTGQQWEGDWEVIVVDNRSTDRTRDIVIDWAVQDPRLRLVRADDRAGQSYAMNVGVAQARADRIAFCDADDVVAQGWVAAMADGLSRHQVVTGPSELDRLNPSWLADSRGRTIEQPLGSFSGIFPCIRGADWGVRREVYERLGGMSEHYRAGQDIDFSLRCWLAGVEIVGLPGAVVHYRYRQAPRELWRQGYTYGYSRPVIARLLKQHGLARPAPLGGWKSWVLLVTTLPSVVTKHGRSRWMWVAGNRMGQLVGSVRERTVML